jgi:type IV secretion system protein VirB5
MNFVQRIAGKLILSSALLIGAPAAHAGIPVIDVANLLQAVMEVINSVTQITNQVSQIRQLYAQYQAITGARNLGAILNNPALQNYIPRDAVQIVRNIEGSGYEGLNGAARAMRDAQMVYNCQDMQGAERTRCQAKLAHPYQTKAFLEGAMERAAGRTQQINALMDQLGGSADEKAALEIQGRIGAEAALLEHEATQIELTRGLLDAQRQIEESRAREGQLEQVSRTGRLADFIQH